MKILYIEDDPNSQRLVSMYLQVAGHRLTTANDARIGLKLAYRERPDVILMDYHLPGVNGMDAVDLIRTTERLKHTPVIAVTASAAQKEAGRFLSRGFDALVPKPIDRHLLVQTIEQVAQIARA